MNAVPEWIQVLQALLTPAIAVAVGVIGFLQWRTAHQKVVLDLFDRRLEVFDETVSFAGEVNLRAFKLDQQTVIAFHTVRRRARFLFGDDVNTLLKTWHEHLIDMSTSIMMIQEYEDARVEHGPRIPVAFKAAAAAEAKLNEAFVPYMRMDQKLIPTPIEWLKKRNAIRLSYADKP